MRGQQLLTPSPSSKLTLERNLFQAPRLTAIEEVQQHVVAGPRILEFLGIVSSYADKACHAARILVSPEIAAIRIT